MTDMIAMLGMYDMPVLQPSNDAFWQAIQSNLGYGPAHLTRDMDFGAMWRSPSLLFGQTCGYPYRTQLFDQVQLVGTPDYGLPDCPAGYYRSVFVTRKSSSLKVLDDCDGLILAFNDDLSQSGWAAPQTELLKCGSQAGALLQTGSHAASASAVVKGDADFAALDLLTWTLLCEHRKDMQELAVIARTDPTPGLPYITARHRDAGALHTAVSTAMSSLGTAHASALHLKTLTRIPQEIYLAVPTPPSPLDTGLPLRQL